MSLRSREPDSSVLVALSSTLRDRSTVNSSPGIRSIAMTASYFIGLLCSSSEMWERSNVERDGSDLADDESS